MRSKAFFAASLFSLALLGAGCAQKLPQPTTPPPSYKPTGPIAPDGSIKLLPGEEATLGKPTTPPPAAPSAPTAENDNVPS